MSTGSLALIKRVHFWQYALLILWSFAWIRRLFNLYSTVELTSQLFGEEGEFNLLISLIGSLMQIVCYALIIKELWRSSKSLSYYIDNRTRHNFAVLVRYQQRVWNYLAISFGIGTLMTLYYTINRLIF